MKYNQEKLAKAEDDKLCRASTIFGQNADVGLTQATVGKNSSPALSDF